MTIDAVVPLVGKLKDLAQSISPDLIPDDPLSRNLILINGIDSESISQEDVLQLVALIASLEQFYLRADKYDEFFELLLKTTDLCKESPVLNLSLPSFHVYLKLGKFSERQKKYKEAKEALEIALEIAKHVGDPEYMAKAFYHLGIVFSKEGNHERGLEHLQQGLDLLLNLPRNNELIHFISSIYNQFGFISYVHKNMDKAVEYYEKSLDNSKETPNDISRAEAYRTLGLIESEKREFSHGEQLLKKAIGIYQKNNCVYEIPVTYKNLGILLINKGDLEEANYYFDESIELLERIAISVELPIIYSYKAKISLLKEEYQTAEDFFKKALTLTQESENLHSRAFAYYYLGQLARIQNRYHVAISFLKRALELFKLVGNEVYVAFTYLESAHNETIQGGLSFALNQIKMAEDILRKSGKEYDLYKLHLTKGIVIRDLSKIKTQAEPHFANCIKILQKYSRASLELIEAYYEYALYWEQMRNTERAVDNLRIAIELSEQLGLIQKSAKYLDKVRTLSKEAASAIQLRSMGIVESKIGKEKEEFVFQERDVTVLFVDICNFTSISEDLSIDRLSSLLNDFYINLTKVILKYNGFVDKFIGDCIMALFNINGDLKNHPDSAVRCGVEMLAELDKVNKRRLRKNEVPIDVRIGLNTGNVLLGSFGTTLKRDYTAVGDNVNVAVRIQSAAGINQVLVSGSTYQRVKDLFWAEKLNNITVKGRKGELTLWRIISPLNQ